MKGIGRKLHFWREIVTCDRKWVEEGSRATGSAGGEAGRCFFEAGEKCTWRQRWNLGKLLGSKVLDQVPFWRDRARQGHR